MNGNVKKTVVLSILVPLLATNLEAGGLSLTVRALDCSSGQKRPIPEAEFYAHFFNPCRGEKDFFHKYVNDFGEATIILPSIALAETLTWSISSPPDYEISFGSVLFSRLGGHYLEACLKKKSREVPKPPNIIIKKTSTWEVIAILSFCGLAYLGYAKLTQ